MKTLLAALILSSCALAQSYTTVTATLQDSTGQVWANASWTTEFSKPPGNNGNFNNGGQPITPNQTGIANASGVFTVVLDDNLVVAPGGSAWKFTICPNASVTSCNVVNLTIFGPTLDVSGQLNAVLSIPVVNAAPVIAHAYNDHEVNGSYGTLYINSIDNTLRECLILQCQGAGWVTISVSTLNPTFLGTLSVPCVKFNTTIPTDDSTLCGQPGVGHINISLPATGGTLALASATGNVSNSGTPLIHQVSVWTDATHIQGVANAIAGNCFMSNGLTNDPSFQTCPLNSPGGSSTQLQFNNSGVFAGISNVAIGSILASKGVSITPAFQSKTIIDVRDYGAIPDGSTDNSIAIAAAFTAANTVTTGPPTVYFGCNGAAATCQYNYGGSGVSPINPLIPMTIACASNGVLLNYTGTAHAVDMGPTSLIAADFHLYTIRDCGFTGGASYTQGILINNFVTNVQLRNLYFLNYGNRTGYTVSANSNNWAILIDGSQWQNTDGFNRNVFDAHSGTAVFLQFSNNFIGCIQASGTACAVTNPAIGLYMSNGYVINNQFLGPEPIMRIAAHAGGGNLGITIVGNTFNTNTNSPTPCITYGDPGAAAANMNGLFVEATQFFCPSASGVPTIIGPETPSSGNYSMNSSRWMNINASPAPTASFWFHFNGGLSNMIQGLTCVSQTAYCDYSTSSITDTNNAARQLWYIPYKQNNQAAGPQAGFMPVMDTTGHFFSTASYHNIANSMTCNDSSGSGTVQSCNPNPNFNSAGSNNTPVAGDCIVYRTTTTNTGALTLSVSGAAASPVQKRQGTVALAAGDLLSGHNTLLCYDGTNWDLLDPITQ